MFNDIKVVVVVVMSLHICIIHSSLQVPNSHLILIIYRIVICSMTLRAVTIKLVGKSFTYIIIVSVVDSRLWPLWFEAFMIVVFPFLSILLLLLISIVLLAKWLENFPLIIASLIDSV